MTHVTSVPTIRVVGGIDTHKDLHMAAVVDRDDGRLLETKDFSTTRAGYRALLRWMRQHGALESVGIEGTGSYGAGIMRFLNAAGVTTHEVDRPDRSDRRRRGKSDAVDAEMAARAVISGRRLSTPKNKNGRVEALRVFPNQGTPASAQSCRVCPGRGPRRGPFPDPDAAAADRRGLAARL